MEGCITLELVLPVTQVISLIHLVTLEHLLLDLVLPGMEDLEVTLVTPVTVVQVVIQAAKGQLAPKTGLHTQFTAAAVLQEILEAAQVPLALMVPQARVEADQEGAPVVLRRGYTRWFWCYLL